MLTPIVKNGFTGCYYVVHVLPIFICLPVPYVCYSGSKVPRFREGQG